MTLTPLLLFAAPQVVPLVLPPGDYGSAPGWGRMGAYVRSESGGKPLVLMVSPATRSSVVRERWAARPQTIAKLGDATISLLPAQLSLISSPNFSVDGVLGADFLRGKVVGFDPDGRTLTIWPADVTETTLREWAGKDAVRVPLERSPNGQPVQRVKAGGRDLRLWLSAAPGTAVIGKSRGVPIGVSVGVVPGSGGSPGRVASEVSAPGRNLGWLLHTVESSDGAEKKIDGVLPIFEGTRGRLVLDVGRSFLLSTPATNDERIAEELMRSVYVSLEVRGGKAFLTGRGAMGPGEIDDERGREVAYLDEQLVPEIIADMKSDRRGEAIKSLIRKWHEGFGLGLRKTEGENVIHQYKLEGEP